MRGALLVGLLAASGLPAQSLLDPAKLPAQYLDFDAQPGDRPLRCEVDAIRPGLDFGFRFQTGYTIRVPMQQYFGPDHAWAILSRVTPENGKPVYLAARVRLPDVPVTTIKSDTFGGFLVGEGRYKVDWALYDDEDRVCRAHWKIEARLKHGERNVKPALPPLTVADFGGGGLPPQPPPAADAPRFRLSILLHAAPVNPRRFHLRASDRILLLSSLSALVEQAAASSVRLAVFNLDKQRVIYSSGDFTRQSMVDVYQALNRLELDTISVKTLGNAGGHIDLLSSLIAGEIQSPEPADAVVFLGPIPRYVDKMPPGALPTPPEGMNFFYFQYRPFFVPGPPMPNDSITNALAALKGRVIHIATPGQFADAIRDLERAEKR